MAFALLMSLPVLLLYGGALWLDKGANFFFAITLLGNLLWLNYSMEAAWTAWKRTDLPHPEAKKWTALVARIAVYLALLFTLRTVFMATDSYWTARTYFIPATSMAPTLQVDDFIIVDATRRKDEVPRRGDIFVFKSPERRTGKTDLVKRVVGLPGDTVEIRDGSLYVNGEVYDFPATEPADSDFPESKISDGAVFVLGDNWNDSRDSRFIGEIPLENLIGRVRFIYMGPGAGTEFP